MNLSLSKAQSRLLLPWLREAYRVDKENPQYATPGAVKAWKEMIRKLRKTMAANKK